MSQDPDRLSPAFFDPVLRDLCAALLPTELLVVDDPVFEAILSPEFYEQSRFGPDPQAKGPGRFFSPARAAERTNVLAGETEPRFVRLDDFEESKVQGIDRIFVLTSDRELQHAGALAQSLLRSVHVMSVKNDAHPALMVPIEFDSALAKLKLPSGSSQRVLVVTAVPRTGSYMLAEFLAGQSLGNAEEHVKEHLGTITIERGTNDFSFVRWLEALKKAASAPTGWTATKLMSHYFALLDQGLSLGEVQYLRGVLREAVVVRVSRRDRVLQAISGYRSMVTKTYRLREAAQEEHYREKEFPYDFDQILERLEWTDEQYENLDALLDRYGVDPINVVYESLVNDPRSAVAKITSAANIPFDEQKLSLIRNRKMRDERSLEYARRFRAESDF